MHANRPRSATGLGVGRWLLLAIAMSAVVAAAPGPARGQPISTAFTYQGELLSSGQLATGVHDLRFRLFDAAEGGAQLGPTLCVNDVAIAGGRFAVPLDFGSSFVGGERYLAIEVRADTGAGCSDATGFTALAPRVRLSPAPNALYSVLSGGASQLGGQLPAFYQNAANLNAGSLPGPRLAGNYAQQLNLSNPLNQYAGIFTGSGAGLSGLDASSLATGTLPDARLSANVARRNAANAFTATPNTFVGRVGVGTISPDVPLHVLTGFSTGVVPAANAQVVIERSGNAYLSFVSGPADLAGVLFGSSVNAADGGLLYDHGLRSLQFRTGGNVTRMHIDPAGFVGVATTAPATRFHIQGSSDVSTAGSGLLTIGNYPSGTFINADGNEIQAFSGESTSTLLLNNLGGGVTIGAGGLSVAGATVSETLRSGSAGSSLTGPLKVGVGLSNALTVLGSGEVSVGNGSSQVFGNPGVGDLTVIDNTTLAGRLWVSDLSEFGDNVEVSGTLSKGAGSFKIDHPLDPDNKFLYHSFVESPDMKNIYDGTAVTDADGLATVTLPEWFVALNRDFRYQITVTDEAAPDVHFARVARKISGATGPASFVIKTTPGNLEVSWQVTGIRRDAFAERHRIPVEEAKAPHQRGKLLHPEAFGRPSSDRIMPDPSREKKRAASAEAGR